MAAKKPYVSLFLNSGSDYSIRDGAGKTYTPTEAKALWEAGAVEDCNAAFSRLVGLDFDIEAVKRLFAEMKAARRPSRA
jgi:hypothetical protein